MPTIAERLSETRQALDKIEAPSDHISHAIKLENEVRAIIIMFDESLSPEVKVIVERLKAVTQFQK